MEKSASFVTWSHCFGMGRQAAQPAEGLHDGDDGIGVDDLESVKAIGSDKDLFPLHG